MEITRTYELHHCPRCGQVFACQPDAPAHCVCFQFKLPESVLQYLRATYDSCVCPNCLRELIVSDENKK